MSTHTNTERFLALKKLSDLKVEYHKRNLKEFVLLGDKYKEMGGKAEKVISAAQMAFKLFRSFRKK